jgi:hypothetical protein
VGHEGLCCAASAADALITACAPYTQVLSIYEVRSLEDQRSMFTELYDKDAIYENNVTLLRGRDEIIKRFAGLPLSTHQVQLEYEKPVVLGATTSA